MRYTITFIFEGRPTQLTLFSAAIVTLFSGLPSRKWAEKKEERVFTTRKRKDVIATQRIFYYIYSVDRVDVAL